MKIRDHNKQAFDFEPEPISKEEQALIRKDQSDDIRVKYSWFADLVRQKLQQGYF